VLGNARRLRAGDRQRLAAKARQKGAVVATTHWHGADLELEVAVGPGSWRGIAGDGHGRLHSRRVLASTRVCWRAVDRVNTW
jgi:hypothetical protein